MLNTLIALASLDTWLCVGLGILLGESAAILLLGVRLRVLAARHEALRQQAGQALSNFAVEFEDVNQRLIAAGFPPHTVRQSTYPAWTPPPVQQGAPR